MKIFASRCLLYIFLISFFFFDFWFSICGQLIHTFADGDSFEWHWLCCETRMGYPISQLCGRAPRCLFFVFGLHTVAFTIAPKKIIRKLYFRIHVSIFFDFYFFIFWPSRTFYPSIAQRQLFTKSPANLYFIICFSSTLFLCVYFVATCNWIGKCTEKRRRNTAERRQSLITPKVKLINRLLGFVNDTYIDWMGEPEKRNGRLGRLTCHGWHFGTCADIFPSFFAAANEFRAGANFFHGGNTN